MLKAGQTGDLRLSMSRYAGAIVFRCAAEQVTGRGRRRGRGQV